MRSKPELMTAGELAAYLRVHTLTIYRLAKRGEIPSFRAGGGWRFDKKTVDDWLREQQKKSKPS
jgi:excisionase family DNA binding protein